VALKLSTLGPTPSVAPVDEVAALFDRPAVNLEFAASSRLSEGMIASSAPDDQGGNLYFA
jgi:hypothetical protein